MSLEGPEGASALRGRRVRVIWNPAAGLLTALRADAGTADDLRAMLQHHGIDADIVQPADEAAAHAAVRQAVADGTEVIVAAGGDGTVHLVADSLIGSDRALGILPLGRVMNIARALGIPRDVDAATDILAAGGVREIDTGEALAADGRVVPFLEAGSVGLNAAIFREMTRADEGRPGSILRTIWVAIRYRPARMIIELDEGTVRTRALMVSVSVGPYLGLGMTVAPGARLDDGRFDVRVFRGYSKLELLRHLASIAFGRRRYAARVSTHRSAIVRITSAHPLPARADSVDLGLTPVTYRTLPRSLRVVAPGEPQPAAGGSSTASTSRRRM